MSTREAPDISDVLERIRTWTPSIGLLQTDAPPPDDEACERIVEQERGRKYR